MWKVGDIVKFQQAKTNAHKITFFRNIIICLCPASAISAIIRKEKISVSEIEDAIQSGADKGSIGLINFLAQLFVNDKISLDQAKGQIEKKNIETLNRTIMQMKIKRENDGKKINMMN